MRKGEGGTVVALVLYKRRKDYVATLGFICSSLGKRGRDKFGVWGGVFGGRGCGVSGAAAG
jgi:hypothetical protein